MNLVVIGGSDAGISAALRAKEVEPGMNITLLCADRYPNFSICGLPFFVSGEVEDWRALAHRTVGEIEEKEIRLLLEHKAEAIDPDRHLVSVRDPEGKGFTLKYDKLIVCTGAVSVKPGISGIDHPGVFPLRWMDDSFVLRKYIAEKKPASAVIVGGGYIGMEMADAFRYLGMEVTIVEFADTVLTTLDPALGEKVEGVLKAHGVEVRTRTPVSGIEERGSQIIIRGGQEWEKRADLVLFAVGVRPEVGLASSAGVALGERGAIRVNRRMETDIADIYAAGDCVETWHRILNKNSYMPLGSTAHKQGLVAGENAAGGNREFQGSLGTQAVKIFELVAARTGLRDSEAKAAGFDPLTAEIEVWDHKAYYPGAKKMIVRLTGDRVTRKLLGVQILGSKESEISKRVDIIAAALYGGMKVDDIPDIDLSYTPPLSSPWDPVQVAAQKWLSERE